MNYSASRFQTLSLPDSFRQSMTTAKVILPKPAVMDARNKCGHDSKGKQAFAQKH
jgi:hypothetical protein